jgi:hypothetical protein
VASSGERIGENYFLSFLIVCPHSACVKKEERRTLKDKNKNWGIKCRFENRKEIIILEFANYSTG